MTNWQFSALSCDSFVPSASSSDRSSGLERRREREREGERGRERERERETDEKAIRALVLQ